MCTIADVDKQKILDKIGGSGRWQRLFSSSLDCTSLGLSAFELLKAIEELELDKIIEVKVIDNERLIKANRRSIQNLQYAC